MVSKQNAKSSGNYKQSEWDEAFNLYSNKIGDKLGLGLDKKVVETVVAFNLLGYKTTMSCEGHKKWGTGGPYIDIEVPGANIYHEKMTKIMDEKGVPLDDKGSIELSSKDFKNLKTIEIKKQELMNKFTPKVQKLLDDFHKTYPSGDFVINDFGSEIRIEPVNMEGIELNKITSKQLEKYQQELQVFGRFLKNKYFGR